MGFSWKFPLTAVGALIVTGCVAYPYETAFDACDADAGACYRYCEQFADIPEDLATCHADCETETNQCFADAYNNYRYARSSYAYGNPGYSPWPWYGRYGYWYPDQGFFFSFNYGGGYGYSGPYYGWPRHRRGHPRRPRGGGGDPYPGGAPQPAPSPDMDPSPPPTPQPGAAPRQTQPRAPVTPRNRVDQENQQDR